MSDPGSGSLAPPLVEVSGLGVRAGETVLLDDVSIAVAAGSIHVVVGPNGAGKSTLIAALLGQQAFRGSIRMNWSGDGRIGYVPQSFLADRTLPVTVAEFLAFQRQRAPVCLGLRTHTRQVVDTLLGRVGLGGMGSRRIGVLSGGELRRLLVANAIDPPPELLLADEPASGMDPAAVTALDATLLELRARHGTTILIVSHDPAQVRRLADQVTVLDRTVRRTGSVAEVFGAEPAAGLLQAGMELP